jgi:hypothetical protein
MTRKLTNLSRISLAAALALGVLLVDEESLVFPTGWHVSDSQARIGRPLTPMSYAGVARRTTRRAVRTGVGAATVYAPGCYQAVDPYGRIYWRCP